jgi:adenylate kinase
MDSIKRATNRSSLSTVPKMNNHLRISLKAIASLLVVSCLKFTSAMRTVPHLTLSLGSRAGPVWGLPAVNKVLKADKRLNYEGRCEDTLPETSVETELIINREYMHSIAPNLQIHGPPKIIIMGGPASGKGTQCEYIAAHYNVVHLSTGDMLRESIRRGDRIGMAAQQFMDAGQLVPDQLIIQHVLERITQPDCLRWGWLLDGFPRTQVQAMALSEVGVYADIFLFLNVPDADLIDRVSGRRSDPVTGKTYHMKFFPPPPDIVNRLVQRSDDTVEKMTNRLTQFHANVSSIKHFYEDVTVEIEGSGGPEEVALRVSNAIQERVLIRQNVVT